MTLGGAIGSTLKEKATTNRLLHAPSKHASLIQATLPGWKHDGCMSMIVHDADLQHMQRMGNPQMYPHTPAQQHAANPQHIVTSPSYLPGQELSNTATYGKQ